MRFIRLIGRSAARVGAILVFSSCAFAIDNSNWIKNLSDQVDPNQDYDHFNVQLAVCGTTVHVSWLANKKDGAGLRVFYRRSTDGGLTFDSTKSLFFNTAARIEYDRSNRTLVADSPYVHVFVYEGWPSKLLYVRSADNGATFEDPVTVSSGYHSYAGVFAASEGEKLVLTFATNNNNDPRPHGLYCVHSEDAGRTLDTTVLAYSDDNNIKTVDGMNVTGYGVSDILLSNGRIYILGWTSVGDGTYAPPSYLFLYSSVDGGTVFKTPLRVNVAAATVKSNAPVIQAANYSPNLAASGDTVTVVWTNIDDPGAMAYTLRVATSTDAGTTMGTPVTLFTYTPGYHSGALHGQESIVRSGSALYVITVMNEAVAGTYVWRSVDGGVSWGQKQTLSSGGWWPHIAVDPSNPNHVHAVNGNYFLSTNGGESFDGGVLTHYDAGDWQSPRFAVGPDGASHYAASVGPNANSYDHDIHYRRVAAQPSPQAANTCVKLVNAAAPARRDHLKIPSTADIEFTTSMTAELWVRRDTGEAGYYDAILTKQRPGRKGSYELGAWSDFKIFARIATDSCADKHYGVFLGGGVTLPKGTWTHIAMTYDTAGTDNFRLYVNGLLANATTVKGAIITDHCDAPLVLGRDGTSYEAACAIDELRLWNRARTQAEIIETMDAPPAASAQGLVAHYNFNATFKDVTGRCRDAMPLYRESFEAFGTTTPHVVALSPANGSTNAEAGRTLVMTFNEPVFKGTGFITVTRSVGSSPEPVFDTVHIESDSVTVSGEVVTIRLHSPFAPSTKYYVTMPAACLSNAAGAAFPGIESIKSWAFTTGSQTPVLNARTRPESADYIGLSQSTTPAIRIGCDRPSMVRVRIGDLSGRIVWEMPLRNLDPGMHRFAIGRDLGNGVYFCVVEKTSGGVRSIKRSVIAVSRLN